MSVSLIDGHIDDDVQMTDNEIIKALEHCERGYCYRCPANKFGGGCTDKAKRLAIDLINRQKAEIERLKASRQTCGTCIYAKPYVGEGKTFKSYVECTNKEHLEKYCKYQNSQYRQKTTKACKCYKARSDKE